MDDPPFTIKPNIGIIGGKGRMGRLIARRLRAFGFKVLIADASDGPWSGELAAQCPVLILAVPISAVEKVMEKIGPYTRKDGVVVDICSLKAGPMAVMLEHARGEVVGAHPLFGPSIRRLKGQVVFLCPGRGGVWLERLESWLGGRGLRVVVTTPERHDRLMARVQTLRHILLAAFGRALIGLDGDLPVDPSLGGPWFHKLVKMLHHQCQQPVELYADLALNNPEAKTVIGALSRSLEDLARPLADGNRRGLEDCLREVEEFFARGNASMEYLCDDGMEAQGPWHDRLPI